MSAYLLVPSHCFSQREIISKHWSHRPISDMIAIVINKNIRSHKLFFMSVCGLLQFICMSIAYCINMSFAPPSKNYHIFW